MGIVMAVFKKDYAPDQRAGRLKRENPERRVSPETMYQYVYREMS